MEKEIKDTYCVRLSEDAITKLKYLAKTRKRKQTDIVAGLVQRGIYEMLQKNPNILGFTERHEIVKRIDIDDTVKYIVIPKYADNLMKRMEYFSELQERGFKIEWQKFGTAEKEAQARMFFSMPVEDYILEDLRKDSYEEARKAYDMDVEMGLYSEEANYTDLPF
jgi:hypothetical protein